MNFQLLLLLPAVWAATPLLPAGELVGHKLLLTSVRTGDTEIFIVDPDSGDAFNVEIQGAGWRQTQSPILQPSVQGD